jgi:hypothetical protein
MNRSLYIIQLFESSDKWVKNVKVKYHSPKDTFTKGADEIARIMLSGANGDKGRAIKRINFYRNRAGKNLLKNNPNQLKEIDKAIAILQG